MGRRRFRGWLTQQGTFDRSTEGDGVISYLTSQINDVCHYACLSVCVSFCLSVCLPVYLCCYVYTRLCKYIYASHENTKSIKMKCAVEQVIRKQKCKNEII